MTAVYAPLQNADATRRGAVTNAEQEIAGLKKFLDGLEAGHVVVVNDHDGETFTADAVEFTANGLPFSLGGPTEADDPFWGVRAMSVVTGGGAGTIEALALGLFPGDGPLDLIGEDGVPTLVPGITFSRNNFARRAFLLADEVLLGLNEAGDAAAFRLDEGKANLEVPLQLDYEDAELLSSSRAFRFGDGVGQLKLRLPLNSDSPGGYELWGPAGGGLPLTLNRDDQLLYSLRESLIDDTVGSPLESVHAFTTEVHALDEYLAVFGTHDGVGFQDFSSAFRITSKGAPEIVEKHAAGPVSDWDVGGDEAEVNTSGTASGVIEEPSSGTYAQITINTSECKLGSLPRVMTVGTVIGSKSAQLIPFVYQVNDENFVVRFVSSDGSGAASWLSAGAGGQLRWEISR